MAHEMKDESAIGLAIVGVLIVSMAAFLGEMTGKVQPTAPMEKHHIDLSSPYMHQKVAEPGDASGATPPSPESQH